jgi:hypothetical protein
MSERTAAVGETVFYYPFTDSDDELPAGQGVMAVITKVHSPALVDLHMTDRRGLPRQRQHVYLAPVSGRTPRGRGFALWPAVWPAFETGRVTSVSEHSPAEDVTTRPAYAAFEDFTVPQAETPVWPFPPDPASPVFNRGNGGDFGGGGATASWAPDPATDSYATADSSSDSSSSTD